MADIARYGTWTSPLGADLVTTAQVGLAQPMLDGGDVYWLESRPEEGGRNVLVRHRPGRGREDLAPAPFNVRTRVHEYGGGACAVARGTVVAVDFADQRVWRIGPGETPRPLTPASDGRLRYADFAFDPGRARIYAVREDHRAGGEPRNEIVVLDLAAGEHEGRVLASGHDFCSAPRPSPDGRRLAWLTWDHPNMPWDGTTLWIGCLGADGMIAETRKVAGGETESIVQPEWSPDGRLHFVSDRSGWWNIWRATEGGTVNVCPMSAEFAGPAWTFAQRWYGFLGASTILACFTEEGAWHLGRIDLAHGALRRLPLPYRQLSGLLVGNGRAVMRAAGPDRPAAIAVMDCNTGDVTEVGRAGELPVDPAWIARPEPMAFPSEGGATAYGFYYPPTSPEVRAPADETPPLVVKSHGGPTGAASTELKLANQFWTSRGFALCDVNYGGSTGYGRAYRERLLGRWGEVDVSDCLSAARHLVADRRADADRLIISGGSAGGYTTLCALTFHDLFRAGASHYGVSDLEALARETHKFESRYLDRLVGPWPAAAAVYRARSPIHHVGRLSCPVIFFQGEEDVIVPPAQAEAMVEALRRKRLPVAYLRFPREQHGFRQAATIRTVLRAELAFYGRVFGFTPADGLAELVVENL